MVTGMVTVILPMTGVAPLKISGTQNNGSFVSTTAAATRQAFSGSLSGSFSAAATDGSGNYSGSIEGTWNASGRSSRVFIEALEGLGSFGGSGIAAEWSVSSYDPQTKAIAILWSAPGNRGPLSSSGTADGGALLVLDTDTRSGDRQFPGPGVHGSGRQDHQRNLDHAFLPGHAK
jgi:hypothetical protein